MPVFNAKCSVCGAPIVLPFIPRTDKPVYCKQCYIDHTSKREHSVKSNPEKMLWFRARSHGGN